MVRQSTIILAMGTSGSGPRDARGPHCTPAIRSRPYVVQDTTVRANGSEPDGGPAERPA
ncbi:hypothetical protein GCM10023215_23460 [Pseudonocardia yuanmonensis]|uniref:Uncharacterized protein n=1 Tax=Pseudonocardia yuanmonensis TaxID=1095914 RepID=A0ABP8WE19_9PSEU